MGPALWRQTIKPYLREMVHTFHDVGLYVMYHSCGSILPIIEDFIEIGVDVLEPIQPKAAGMDPLYLKQAFGSRLCFHGGVDEQELLPLGTPQQIRAEVRRLGRVLGQEGGYIMMAAHALQSDTPYDNVLAMYETDDVQQRRSSGG